MSYKKKVGLYTVISSTACQMAPCMLNGKQFQKVDLMTGPHPLYELALVTEKLHCK